jgi:hypothetical protein
MTRGTRPKKPSCSRGFACKARGSRRTWGTWGTWGLKTENRIFFFSFQAGNNCQKKNFKNKIKYLFIYFRASASVQTADYVRRGGGRGGEAREGTNASARTPRVRARVVTATDGQTRPSVTSDKARVRHIRVNGMLTSDRVKLELLCPRWLPHHCHVGYLAITL